MKISELISELEKLKTENGDIPVVYLGYCGDAEEIDRIVINYDQHGKPSGVEVYNEFDDKERRSL
jgi:uncharacterized protein YuzE